MEDQTNNRIREEWEKVYLKSEKDSLGGNLPYKVISSEESSDWWLSKIDELLKSQEHKLIEELVDRLQGCAWCDLENGRGKYLLESDIISLIKNN